MNSRWLSSENVSKRKQEAPELRAQRQNQNGDRDGYIYGSDGPNKAKTKQKNSLDSETQKRDNGKCYVTN